MQSLYWASLVCLFAFSRGILADQYDGLPQVERDRYLETCTAPPPAKGSGLYATDRSLCWDPGGKIKVQFLDGSVETAAFVLKTASEWSESANIKFVAVKSDGDIRVTFTGLGFRSRIGRDALGVAQTKATMTLGFASDSVDSWRRHILHEFGHALGFSHEHQSPDAHIPWDEKAVTKFCKSLDPPWTTRQIQENFLNPIPPKSGGGSSWTAFDKLSIMLYPVSPNLTKNHTGYGWNKDLSPLDRKKARELYKW